MIQPRRHSPLRLAAFRLAARVAQLAGGRRFYRWRYLSGDRLVVRHERVELGGSATSDPTTRRLLRIVQVSDVHGGPFVGPGDLADLIDAVEGLSPDVVAVTGDFVADTTDELPRVADDLARLDAPLGVFAVFGNHDYKDRREPEIVRAFPRWRFLRNECVALEGPTGARIGIAGIEDIEEGRPADVERATGLALQGADVLVALSHGPEAAPAFAARGFDLVLSGHSHGTQIDLPFLRRLGPAHPGLVVALGRTRLVVSRGVGPIGVPVRVRAPAEIVCVDIVGSVSQDRGPCRDVSASTPACSTSDVTR
ncbi:MAG: metallophosphoesterase [Planctomycetota bacterium]